MPIKFCWRRRFASRVTFVYFAEVAKSCSIDDVTVRVEEKEGTLRSTIKDREGVTGPAVIKQTHAHGYTHAEKHKK